MTTQELRAPEVRVLTALAPRGRHSRRTLFPAPRALQRIPVGRDLTGPVFLVVCLGLALHAYAADLGRRGGSELTADFLFWVSLLVMFVPVALRVVAASTPARERLVLTWTLPLALMLSRVLLYPTLLPRHDELAHLNTLRLIEQSHHLFDANSLLPPSPAYPGLEIATSAVMALTGLSAVTAGYVVLFLARIVMTGALLGAAHRLTGSLRAACLVVLVYSCNPQYLYFNSQYSYQSLALPLVLVALYVATIRPMRNGWVRLAVAAPLLLGAIVTHHLTSMLAVAALAVVCVVELVRRGRTQVAVVCGALALLGSAVLLGWAVLPGNPVGSYLETIVSSSVDSLSDLASGQQSRQELFADGSGSRAPLWQRMALVSSLLLVTALLVPALLWARRERRVSLTVGLLLAVVAAAYPLIPAGHLTSATSEVTDRSSGFVFLGVALVLSAWFLRRPFWSALETGVLVGVLALVFVGQTIFGIGPVWSRVPGPFLVSADSRTVDADNLAAAQWQRDELPDGRVLADRVGRLLSASIGGKYSVTHIGDGIDASKVLLGPTFDETDIDLVRRARLDYVVVDLRDATGLPRIGVYYESGEFEGRFRRTPVTRAALDKLAAVPTVQRLYDNGSVIVYDVRGLR